MLMWPPDIWLMMLVAVASNSGTMLRTMLCGIPS